MMVKAYNLLLAKFCRSREGLHFVDLNPYITIFGEDKVHPCYTDRVDPTNLHLIWERTLPAWCELIPCLRDSNIQHDARKLEEGAQAYAVEKSNRMLMRRP